MPSFLVTIQEPSNDGINIYNFIVNSIQNNNNATLDEIYMSVMNSFINNNTEVPSLYEVVKLIYSNIANNVIHDNATLNAMMSNVNTLSIPVNYFHNAPIQMGISQDNIYNSIQNIVMNNNNNDDINNLNNVIPVVQNMLLNNNISVPNISDVVTIAMNTMVVA